MTTESIAALLREAAKTHHTVYRITDGHDPDWASWYAEWLLTLSELPELLGRRPVRSNLVHALVDLERRFHADPGWEMRYAAHLLDWFGGDQGSISGLRRSADQPSGTAAAPPAAVAAAADEAEWPSFESERAAAAVASTSEDSAPSPASSEPAAPAPSEPAAAAPSAEEDPT